MNLEQRIYAWFDAEHRGWVRHHQVREAFPRLTGAAISAAVRRLRDRGALVHRGVAKGTEWLCVHGVTVEDRRIYNGRKARVLQQKSSDRCPRK